MGREQGHLWASMQAVLVFSFIMVKEKTLDDISLIFIYFSHFNILAVLYFFSTY